MERVLGCDGDEVWRFVRDLEAVAARSGKRVVELRVSGRGAARDVTVTFEKMEVTVDGNEVVAPLRAAVVDLTTRLSDRDLIAPDPTVLTTAAPLQIEAAPTAAGPPTTAITTTGADTEPTEPPPKKRKRREKRIGDVKAGQHHQLDFNELKDIATLWKEYSEGINGGPALRDLEAQGKKWRCIGNSAGKGACRQRWSMSLPFYEEIQFRVARGDSETAAVAAVQLMLDDTPRNGPRSGPNFAAVSRRLRAEQKARVAAASPAPEPPRAPEELA